MRAGPQDPPPPHLYPLGTYLLAEQRLRPRL